MIEERMSFKEYCQIANMLKDIRRLLSKYPTVPPKKSNHWKYRTKAEEEIDDLRSHLEELMFIDCQNEVGCLSSKEEPFRLKLEWATHIFFDCAKRVDPDNKLIYTVGEK